MYHYSVCKVLTAFGPAIISLDSHKWMNYLRIACEISWERGSTWPNPYIGVGTVNNHPGQYGNALNTCS